ncbi:UDP-sugar transporter UST74c [Gryllus bimaculatus]|nr:UDP-sugar transporter UST74c [Gryllus bimaculatus]
MRVLSDETLEEKSLVFRRIGSAIFYGLASFMITVVNKTVLTSYQFPSFQVLGIGQMTATVILLYVAKRINLLSFPSFEFDIFKKIFPLPLIYIGNMIFGLGGTKELSLPMLTVLRRFSILMTMLGEFYILGKKPRIAVQLSVYTMILGAFIAASNDLAFSVKGYTLVLLSDLFTAVYGVVMKQKLDAAELGKYGLMFYNSLFMLLPAIAIATFTGDLDAAARFQKWDDVLFLIQFFMSCVMGFVLSYSVILCTLHNSALTTTVIGCLKNVCVTYLGMLIGGDYVFSVINFVGINVSVFGSLMYTWVTFRRTENPVVQTQAATTNVTEEPGCQITDDSSLVQSLKIVSDVRHRYAVTTLMSNIENLGNETQETELVFIIPESAYVSSFYFIANDIKYKTAVKSKEEAQQVYQNAVGAGESAAHISTSARESDVFTISVNVEPKSSISYNLTYEELLSRRHSLYDLTISIMPKQALRDLDIYVNIRETNNITKLVITIPGNETYFFTGPIKHVGGNFSELATNFSYRTAKIQYHPSCDQQQFMLNNSDDKELNYQLRVQYDVNRTQSSSEILFGDGHFVHFFAPESLSPIPLHIIFVLDTSTSMWGRKIEQLQVSMKSILGKLRSEDHFSLIHFGNDVSVWSTQPQETVGINRYNFTHEANKINIDRATYFISTLNVTGGTNINSALRKALELAAKHKVNSEKSGIPGLSVPSIILLLSDGIPTTGELRSSRILATTRARNTEIQATIFSLSIGDSANFGFLRRLSLQNHGFARKIYEASDTAIQLESFFEEISSPLLTNINFFYSGRSILQDSITINHFHSYFKGGEIIVAGKYKVEDDVDDSLNFNNEVTGWNKKTEIHQKIQAKRKINIQEEVDLLERLWAYLTIQQLIKQQIAEGGSNKKNQTYKNVARKMALKYKFVTPLTSLIVMKPENELPYKLLAKPIDETEEGENFVFQNKIVSIPMRPFQNHVHPSLGLPTDMANNKDATTHNETDISQNNTELLQEYVVPWRLKQTKLLHHKNNDYQIIKGKIIIVLMFLNFINFTFF